MLVKLVKDFVPANGKRIWLTDASTEFKNHRIYGKDWVASHKLAGNERYIDGMLATLKAMQSLMYTIERPTATSNNLAPNSKRQRGRKNKKPVAEGFMIGANTLDARATRCEENYARKKKQDCSTVDRTAAKENEKGGWITVNYKSPLLKVNTKSRGAP